MNDFKPLNRNDPIDEHEMKIIVRAIEQCEKILQEIPNRIFSISIKEE